MALGQRTYLQLANRALIRLGKAQVTTLVGTTTDTWPDFVKILLNDAQQEIGKEHDWSTLITSVTFTTSSRTYNLATSVSTFGREIDLVDTGNRRVLVAVNLRDIDEQDPANTISGVPTAYAIHYPDLLFNLTPTSVAFRLRYVKRPTDLSADADVSTLPEYCDLPMVWWVVWQLYASREDAADGGGRAQGIYQRSLDRAIAQDRNRMDRLYRLRPMFGGRWRDPVPWPAAYDTNP